MNFTIVLLVFGRLKALFVLATDDSMAVLHILSKVKAFCRKHVSTNRNLEIFVRNESISVQVKVVETLRDFCFRNVHAPKVQEKLEFLFADLACLFDIEVREGFSECFPLELHFFKDSCYIVSLKQTLLSCPSVF
jgi:hypothetical protein